MESRITLALLVATALGGAAHGGVTVKQKGTKVTVHSDGTVLIEAKRGMTLDAGAGPLELRGQQVSIKAMAAASLPVSVIPK